MEKEYISTHDLALFAKRMEIEALEKAKTPGGSSCSYDYLSGKAQAFSEIWERLIFNGKTVSEGTVHPEEYNKQNGYWSKMVAANEKGGKWDAPEKVHLS